MKRDMELVRKILFEIEKESSYDQQITLKIDDYENPDIINFHLLIMREGGLIELFGIPRKSFNASTYYFPSRLTWAGCDFLDSIRDESIWKKTLKTIKDIGFFTSLLVNIFYDTIKQYETSRH